MAHADSSVSVSLCPSPALPEEQRHHSPAPGTSPTFGLCCILLLHQESLTEKRKNQECWDMGAHLSTAKKDAFPSGFCLHRGKDPSTANSYPNRAKGKATKGTVSSQNPSLAQGQTLGDLLSTMVLKKKKKDRKQRPVGGLPRTL